MKCGFLHYSFYIENRTPTYVKMTKLRMRSRQNNRPCESPILLKIDKFRLTPTPTVRTRTSYRKPNTEKPFIKESTDFNIFSENLNNYIENHPLTSISPTDVINHFTLEYKDSPKKKNNFVVENRPVPITIPRYNETEILTKDLEKLETELFENIREKKKTKKIEKHSKTPDRNFQIVGSSLNFNIRKNHSRFNSKSFKVKKKIKNICLKSPNYEFNQIDV